MTAERLDRWAATMNALPFVRWDRAIPGGGFMDVYGWIDRDDGRADFVLLTFFDERPTAPPWFSTSSARYSAEIAAILSGGDVHGTHNECERVTDVFGDRVANRVG